MARFIRNRNATCGKVNEDSLPCMYFAPDGFAGLPGTCRYNLPIVGKEPFPQMYDGQWCGHHPDIRTRVVDNTGRGVAPHKCKCDCEDCGE